MSTIDREPLAVQYAAPTARWRLMTPARIAAWKIIDWISESTRSIIRRW